MARPIGSSANIKKVEKFVLDFIFEHRRKPTPAEVITGTAIPRTTVYRIMSKMDDNEQHAVLERALELGAVVELEATEIITYGYDDDGKMIWRKRKSYKYPDVAAVGNAEQINITRETQEVSP